MVFVVFTGKTHFLRVKKIKVNLATINQAPLLTMFSDGSN